MFNSSYKVQEMINMVKAEVDSYNEIPGQNLLMSYNTVIRQIYRGIIKEQRTVTLKVASGGKIVLRDGSAEEAGLARIEYEDIEKIKIGHNVYAKATAKSTEGFRKSYRKGVCETANGVVLDTVIVSDAEANDDAEVYYDEKPKTYTSMADISEITVPLPDEYVGMIYSALRGDAYKWVNEDELSAKWTADYNAQLEAFTEWIRTTKPQFGI